MTKNIIKALIPKSVRKGIRSKQKRIKARSEFQSASRQTDVYLVGHPKSGNTWLAYMLGIVLNAEKHDEVTLANISQYVPNIHNHDEKIAEFNHLDSPRVFRNESPVFPDLYPKTIYIVRDPRAVLLSYYHHSQHATKQPQRTLEVCIDEMLEYGCIKSWEPALMRWDTQVMQWLKRSESQPVKVIRYEDLVEDRRDNFKDVIDFAGISCDENLLSLAVEKGEFKSMQKDEMQHGAESYPGEKGSKGYFVRKGKIDSWKKEMSGDIISKIENKYHATMKTLAYLP